MNIGQIGHSAAAMPTNAASSTSPSGQSKSSPSGGNDPNGGSGTATDSFLVNLIQNSLQMHAQLFDFAKESMDEDDG